MLMERKSVDSGVWIIFLEAGVALALLVFIVWWTMPRGKPENRKARKDPKDPVTEQAGQQDQQGRKH